MPVEAIFFLAFIYLCSEKLPEYIEVDLAFGKRFGKKRLQMLDIFGENVSGSGFWVVGGYLFHAAPQANAWQRFSSYDFLFSFVFFGGCVGGRFGTRLPRSIMPPTSCIVRWLFDFGDCLAIAFSQH